MEHKQLSILHLSDIHITNGNNYIFDKKEALFDAIKNEISNKLLFIIITGDLSNTGKKEEYIILKSILDNLEQKIAEYCADIRIEYIFVAGNHDCDFSDEELNDARDLIIDNIISQKFIKKDSYINTCTKIQNNYFEFISAYKSNNHLIKSVSNALMNKYIYEISSHKISFNCYNSAWMSKRKEKQSEIIFPLSHINQEQILQDDSSLKISLLHHPFHWLEHNNLRDFRNFLNSSSTIIFSGHEHTITGNIHTNISTKSIIEVIEGGNLQNNNNEKESSFNLINFNLDTKEHDILNFKWEESYYKKDEHIGLKINTDSSNLFALNPSYKVNIEKLHLKLNHPRKEDILLEDFFIFQDLELINLNKKTTNILFKNISSNKFILDEIIGLNILYGEDNCGKSSLISMLQLKIKEKGTKIPIVIKCENISSNIYDKSRLEKIIQKSFEKQYVVNEKIISLYHQQNKDKFVLILDDFNLIKANEDLKSLIIENLLKLNYTNILLFANKNFRYEATSETKIALQLNDFNHFQIKELGHELREDLITKWIKLGQEYEIKNDELRKLKREKSEHIDHTIGFNIIPSYPLYILTLLQAMEINDNTLEKSSYGHYYNFLIVQHITNDSHNGVIEQKDINTIFAFSSALAYDMFTKQQKEYLVEDLNIFNDEYIKNKKITLKFKPVEKLISTRLLIEVESNTFKFTHKYIYYYFVAYYFAQNIDNSDIVSIIQKMSKQLYKSEFANILMFILHLSVKKHIITMILDEASNRFVDTNEFRFDKEEIKKINSLVKDSTTKLLDRHIDESRKEELKEKEEELKIRKENHSEEDDEDCNFDDEETEQLTFFKELNHSFKLIEIMGEITKNYSGALDGDIKHQLIQNCYSLGLKCIKEFILLFEERHEQLIEQIQEIITKRGLVTSEKIGEATAKTVFALASAIALDIVKKISKSVGTQDLKIIYKEILDSDIDNIAYQIINEAINLSFIGGLNKNKVITLHENLKNNGNNLTDLTLKNLIVDYFYKFDVSIEKKTSICSRLGIDIEHTRQNLLDRK